MVNKITGIKVFIVPMTVGLALLASILYVKPAYDKMQSAKKDQVELKKKLGDLEGQNKKLSEIKVKWETMSDEKTLVEGSLPVDVSADYYIPQLYDRASRSGVLLSSISVNDKGSEEEDYVCGAETGSVVAPSNSSSKDDSSGSEKGSGSKSAKTAAPVSSCVKAASISLEVNGNWEQVLNFFKYLEDSNRIANVKSVEISGSKESDLLKVDLGASVYYKEKSAAASSSVASSLTSGKGFEEGVIKKLNEIIFTPYVAPMVSASGERNLFK